MRINDLSKEIGKSNRELLSFLEKQGRKAAPMSNVTAEEANLIRDYFKPKNTEASRVDKSKTQQDGAERAEMQGEQPKKKKKFTAVFRPENAQQIRVKNSGNEGAKPQEKAVPEKAAEKTAEKPKENVEKKPETAAPQKKPADSRPPIKTAVSSRLPRQLRQPKRPGWLRQSKRPGQRLRQPERPERRLRQPERPERRLRQSQRPGQRSPYRAGRLQCAPGSG